MAAGTAGSSLARDGAPERATRSRRRLGAVSRDTALFVVGFGGVFVVLGLSASALGRTVIHHQGALTRISGVVVVAMALFLAGTVFLRSPALYGEWRPHPRLARFGPLAAPVAGAAFAFGWTPCVGPILASVLALSTDQGHLGRGALLLAVYSMGLGTPFLVVAVFFDRMRGPLACLRRQRHQRHVGLSISSRSPRGAARGRPPRLGSNRGPKDHMTVHPNFRCRQRTFRHRRGVSLPPSCYLAGGLSTARTDAVDGDGDGDGRRGLRAHG